MGAILACDAIAPDQMRTDNFYAFLRARAGALLNLVDKATGKQIAGRDSEETIHAIGGPPPPRSLP
jgi:hypothetical protein